MGGNNLKILILTQDSLYCLKSTTQEKDFPMCHFIPLQVMERKMYDLGDSWITDKTDQTEIVMIGQAENHGVKLEPYLLYE